MPGTRRATSPFVLVVAGYASDLAAVSEKADLRIDLGDLPIHATSEYFRNLNDDIQTKMEKNEMQAYANASARAPALIDKLTRLLRLD